jgi:hypothetical protein
MEARFKSNLVNRETGKAEQVSQLGLPVAITYAVSGCAVHSFPMQNGDHLKRFVSGL